MKKLLLVVLAVVVVSTLIFSACAPKPAPPKGPTVLKFVAMLPDVPPGNVFNHMLMDKVKTKSNGELIIDWVGGPEAIPPFDTPAAVKKGTIDMVSSIYSAIDTIIPGWECLAFSMLTIQEFRKSDAYDIVVKLCKDENIHFLGHAVPCKPFTMAAYFSNKKVEKPEDFAGLKIAVPGPADAAFVTSLKATPVMMHFVDYFTALERGVVDGYTAGLPVIIEYGLVDVTKYMIDETVLSCGAAYLVNLGVWNKLSKDQQDVLTKATIEMEIEGEILWDNVVAGVRKDMSAAGVELIKFSPADSKRFRDMYIETVWNQAMPRNPELVAKFKKILVP